MLLNILIDLKDLISQPWPWYVAGPMLAILMFILLYFGHEFGISENFRIMCAADGADQLNEFFKFDWKSGGWNLMVALGAVFGGYIVSHYFLSPSGNYANVSPATVNSLEQLGFKFENGKVPCTLLLRLAVPLHLARIPDHRRRRIPRRLRSPLRRRLYLRTRHQRPLRPPIPVAHRRHRLLPRRIAHDLGGVSDDVSVEVMGE